jgi:hypothetical protein
LNEPWFKTCPRVRLQKSAKRKSRERTRLLLDLGRQSSSQLSESWPKCLAEALSGNTVLLAKAHARAAVLAKLHTPFRPPDQFEKPLCCLASLSWGRFEPVRSDAVLQPNPCAGGRGDRALKLADTSFPIRDENFVENGAARPGLDLSSARRPGGVCVEAFEGQPGPLDI